MIKYGKSVVGILQIPGLVLTRLLMMHQAKDENKKVVKMRKQSREESLSSSPLLLFFFKKKTETEGNERDYGRQEKTAKRITAVSKERPGN